MIEHWISTYGYLAVFVGTLLEGETVLVLAGFAAHRGYLGLAPVIAAAFAGGLAGDQIFFYLGRSRSEALLRRRPTWRRPVERVRRMLERHQLWVVLGFRFFYGIRTVTPMAIGMSGFPRTRFLVLNAAGTAIWATLVGTLGYLFGQSLELVLGDLRRYEAGIMVAIAAVGAALWAAHWLRSRRRHPITAVSADPPDTR